MVLLYSPKVQEIYAQLGYRPSNDRIRQQYANQGYLVQKQYRIADFSRWGQVNKELFSAGSGFWTSIIACYLWSKF
jgi:sulfate transport system substrate-binding protein